METGQDGTGRQGGVRFDLYSQRSWASLVAQMLMSLPAMQETQV